MCQLTFADFSEDYKFLSGYIPLLVLIDSLDNNPDGYGMNLNSEISKVRKTPLSANQFLLSAEFDSLQKEITDFCGIHHVRLASKNKNIISVENTHPFSTNRLILAHNGTLNSRYNSLPKGVEIPKGALDSYEFLLVLDHFLGKDKKLSTDVLNKALACFTGTYAFLIRDLQTPDILHIVKGRDKTLAVNKFKIDGKTIGIVINTERESLDMWTWWVMFQTQLPLEVEKQAISNLTHDTYKIGDFDSITKVGEIKEYVPEVIRQTSTPNYYPRNRAFYSDNLDPYGGDTNYSGYSNKSIRHTPAVDKDKVLSTYNNIILRMYCDYSPFDIRALSEAIFGRNFFSLTKKEIIFFDEILTYLETKNMSLKKEMWNKIVNTSSFPVSKVYTSHNLVFPYFYNLYANLEDIPHG